MTQRITSEEAAALTRQVSSTQISAWNAAGTWEERGHTDWARARLETLVVERGKFDLDGAFAGVVARVVGLKTCEGGASVVMIRGKPRHGFDFETTLEWRASFAEEDGEDGEDEDGDEAAVEVSPARPRLIAVPARLHPRRDEQKAEVPCSAAWRR